MSRIRNLRADAQHNHDRLLEAAASAFARDGSAASLKAIAQDAGVGIGTLYRRFPTREALVEATFRSETARLCAQVDPLLERADAAQSLRRWGTEFFAVTEVKHALLEALPGILSEGEELGMTTRTLVLAAISKLLAAGELDGTLRSDVAAEDVMMALAAIGLVANKQSSDDGLSRRLLGLFVDGLEAGRHTGSRST